MDEAQVGPPEGPHAAAERHPSLLDRVRDADHRAVAKLAGLDQAGPLRPVMLAATRLADGWAVIGLVPLVVVGWRARGVAAVGLAVLGCVATAVIVQSTKAFIRRARPSGLPIERPIGAPDRHAFPSGHTSQAFAILVVLAWLSPWLALAFAPVVLLVGLSRMFFGLHYPTDVLVGGVLGCAITSATIWIAQGAGWVDWMMRTSPLR